MTRSEKCNESAGILHALRLTTSGGLCASQALRALRALAQLDGYGISERVKLDMHHEFSSLRALVHCACALHLRGRKKIPIAQSALCDGAIWLIVAETMQQRSWS